MTRKNLNQIHGSVAKKLYNYGFSIVIKTRYGYHEEKICENQKCGKSWNEIRTAYTKKYCTTNKLGYYPSYFIHNPNGGFHLVFEDGSNPYVHYCNIITVPKRLKTWLKNYRIVKDRVKNNILYLTLAEK